MTYLRRPSVLGTFLVAALLWIPAAEEVWATPFPGPDAFGYAGATIPSTLRNISSSGTFVPLSDDGTSSPLPIGFTFSFYGINYTTFRISSNGFITIGSSVESQGCCTGGAIPNGSSPNNLVSGWWEDLNAPQGNIRFQTVGSAPNRELIVGFYDVPHFLGGVPVTFEIVLHEGSSDIEIQCSSCLSDGGTHSIGIENGTGTIGLEVFRGASPQIQQGWLLSRNEPPDCSNSSADPDEIWPPNHEFVPVDITGVTDPDGDVVTFSVGGVFQNEPVEGRGSGDTSPDAVLDPLEVRAEREDRGNGRVYHIDFTADDGNGETCEGTVTVCVPHRPSGDGCDGPLFDSTVP